MCVYRYMNVFILIYFITNLVISLPFSIKLTTLTVLYRTLHGIASVQTLARYVVQYQELCALESPCLGLNLDSTSNIL